MLEGLFASALSYAMAIFTIFAVNVKIFDDDLIMMMVIMGLHCLCALIINMLNISDIEYC